MSVKTAYGFWDSLFQDKVTKRIVEITTILAALWFIYFLVNKFFDNWADKEFALLRHKIVPGAKDPDTGKKVEGDTRTGNQANPLAPNYVPPPSLVNTVTPGSAVYDQRMTMPTSGTGSYNDVASKIAGTRHALSKNDYEAALSFIETAQTKTDLALIVSAYDSIDQTSILGTGIGAESLMTYLGGLSSDQKAAFQKWSLSLPDYSGKALAGNPAASDPLNK